MVSPSTEYSVIPKVDAFRLGYTEAARDNNLVTMPPNLARGLTYDGYWEGMMIKIREVVVAGVSAVDVPFIAFDIPQLSSFDVVLGMPLLRMMMMQIDCSKNTVRLMRPDAGLGVA